jgi:hypothetical protein
MNLTTEILIAVAIVGSIALQFGEHALDIRRLFVPLLIVGGFAVYYLRSIPTSGGDGVFTLVGLAIGLLLGAAAAALMGVRRDGSGRVIVSAGVAYVALWIVTFGARLSFAIIATQSPDTLRQTFIWAYEHGITELGWTAFFMVQAIAMVGLRTAIVGLRALSLRRESGEVVAVALR